MRAKLAFCCIAAACTLTTIPAAIPALAQSSPGYRILNSYTLGGEGGWDYLNLDPATGNLFITRGSHVMVVDPASGKLLGDITGLQGIHGTAFVGGAPMSAKAVPTGSRWLTPKVFPRFPRSPSAHGRTAFFMIRSPSASSPSTAPARTPRQWTQASGKAVGTVALGGKPEAAVSDGAGTIFVNIEDKSELVAFDAKSLAVKQHYPLAPCEEPSGGAADLAHGRIFSGCDNKMIAVTDMKTGKVVTTIPIGEGVDANRFDPGTGLVFSSNGESGTLTIAHEDSPGKFTVLQNLVTGEGARTMELDTKSHRVYVVTADRKPGTPTADRPKPRPVPVPGTFRLIVLGR